VAVQSTFSRARSAEQRAERRAAILDTAAAMLATSRVAGLSLNELARNVGLAKSNVLRYFESREAILLGLLGREYDEWLGAIAARLQSSREADPVERVATAVSATAADRPLLCELLASAALVLEHNVSADVAADYKRGALARAIRLAALLVDGLGIDGQRAGAQLAGAVNLAVGGIWGMCRPSPGMAAAYEKYPELAGYQLDFEPTLHEFMAVLLTGLIERERRGSGR
jgi:AcrR family transcriptional regulator